MLTTTSCMVTSLTLWRAGAPPSSQTGAEQRAMVTRARLRSTLSPVTRLTITGCLEQNVGRITSALLMYLPHENVKIVTCG